MEVGGQHGAPASLPREKTPVRVEREVEWAPELVWTFQRREKALASSEIRTPDRQICRLVAIPATLS